MKKLVSIKEVKAAAESGQKTIFIDENTILTAAAGDMARELGVKVTTKSAGSETVPTQGSGLPKKDTPKNEIDPEMILQVVKAVLSSRLLENGLLSSQKEPFRVETDSKSGFKLIRGRTVNLQTFDTGDSTTDVAYREVISMEDSQMSAGFLTIEKSSFDWELSYEEIDIVLEGSLDITINGETHRAYQGDILFVPKGSKVTWGSADYVKLFYVTYPANWAAQTP